MKIQLLSDLHLEFKYYPYPLSNADVVVLAGDIHTKERGIKWALEEIKNKPVIYVLGNHEYYKKAYPKLTKELKELSKGTNVHVLENDIITIDGVNFFGCTLWTDYELFGNAKLTGYECQQVMSDFKKIRRLPNFAKIRSIDIAIIHNQSRKWLEDELARKCGETNVVVTHHAPSIQSIAEEYHDDITTAAYASNLEPLIRQYQPALWLHGHVHKSSDYQIENCRILCNPRGYPDAINPQYNPQIIIDVN
ncbi:phosphoesterase [Aliikangiella coralliicola]|uniref:Phosphoesterase n=2 Tax=Aliikangiella coralliicola TaxID=2592383 RepID=A0A545UF64_9GAMM|nr:phosphoesterase [Aliikangiella coralliicola]